MTKAIRKAVLYISASLDGYIAGPNGDMSFLESVQNTSDDYGYRDFYHQVDTVLMGRKTFEWVYEQVGNPHPEKAFYVLSKKSHPDLPGITFYRGEIIELLKKLKSEPGKFIYCDGGAQIANEFLRAGLIDTIILSVIPVILGGGTPLFQTGWPQNLNLKECKAYSSGLVQLKYELI